MMICSINETRSIIIDAAKGAGYSYSLARSLSYASVWMAQRGFEGIDGCLLALSSNIQKEKRLAVESQQTKFFSPVQVANSGSSIMDFLIAVKPNSKVELLNVDVPVLMVGFAGIIAEAYNLQVVIDFLDDGKVTIEGDQLLANGAIPLKDSNMNISINEKARINQVHQLKIKKPDLFISADSWEKLQKLAVLTYVEVTDLSHNLGAGAGLIDND